MNLIIMECMIDSYGRNVEKNKSLIENLQAMGHTVELYVPKGVSLNYNSDIPVHYTLHHNLAFIENNCLKRIYSSIKNEFYIHEWFKTAYELAKTRRIDAIIFPNATYKFLRSLRINKLKNSPIPLIFLIDGINLSDCSKIGRQAYQLALKINIRIGIQSFARDKLTVEVPNVVLMDPSCDISPNFSKIDNCKDDIFTMGIFGKYRKGKKIEDFLDVYSQCEFFRKVKLIVQFSNQTQEGREEFLKLVNKYSHIESIEFRNEFLDQDKWKEQLLQVDSLVIPYSGENYIFKNSLMLLNAIAFHKPVLISNHTNPEVLKEYKIGNVFEVGNKVQMKSAIEGFVNRYEDNRELYLRDLERAEEYFSPAKLAQNVVKLAGN